MVTRIFTFCALLLSFALLLNSSPTLGEEVPITLIYSCNTMGEVDPSC